MNLLKNILGEVCLMITSADPTALLRKLTDRGFALFDLKQIDSLTFTAKIPAKDYRRLCMYLKNSGCKCSVVGREGAYWLLFSIRKRGLLLGFVLLILLATVLIPTRIFFIRVIGNETLSDQYIMEQAATCGMTFGVTRKYVRSEKIKNALLESIPELQWAGVNSVGCVATIRVRERNVIHKSEEQLHIGNIVAERDGIIYSCTTERGYPLCQVGQAVRKGQTLVSGYQDLGLLVIGSPVKADIYALTQRAVSVISPCEYKKRTDETMEISRYSIQVGKNKINLYKDSGIYDGTCVKMYEEDYLTLPGGFRIPLALIKERIIYTSLSDTCESNQENFDWLYGYSNKYIAQQMIAGQILYENIHAEIVGPVCVQYGKYACVEMIGKYKAEEIVGEHGENNGKNR